MAPRKKHSPAPHGVGEFSTSEKLVIDEASYYDTTTQTNAWSNIGLTPETNQEAIDGLASSLGLGFSTRTVIWDFSVDGAGPVISTGVTLPDLALVLYSTIDVLTPIVGASDISFQASQNLGNTDGSTVGHKAGAQDWTTTNSFKTGAVTEITATLTGTPTAGRVKLITVFLGE